MPIFGAKSRAARGCASKLACGRRIDPAEHNCKIANPIGKIVKRPVGADDPVRPWGNRGFAATYRKNGCASCGESAASPPTNVVRIRRYAFVFAGAYRRADRGVRPYGRVPFHIGAVKFPTLCRAGGASPAPTLRRNVATAQNGVGSDPFQVRFAHPPPLGHQGEALMRCTLDWCGKIPRPRDSRAGVCCFLLYFNRLASR